MAQTRESATCGPALGGDPGWRRRSAPPRSHSPDRGRRPTEAVVRAGDRGHAADRDAAADGPGRAAAPHADRGQPRTRALLRGPARRRSHARGGGATREPGHRPAILYALLTLAGRQAAGETVTFFPSDHFVSDDAAFMQHVAAAADSVARRPDLTILLGVMPDRAESGYGWIQPGSPVAGSP